MDQMKKITVLLFYLIVVSVSAQEMFYNVLDYGAKGDGKTINTKAINSAINTVAKNGGGTVYFPAGDYLTGTIYLKNNVSLNLQKGALILGSTELRDYPENFPEYQFYRRGTIKRALIYAEKCENIAIKGEGTIDGQGAFIKKPNGEAASSYGERPHVIWMIQSKNVSIEGVKLQNSALWMQHYIACENLYIHNIEVYNHANKNNDMMDINGCKDVIISDCRGDTDDDGITLKSTHAMPNENIVITNCIISSHCNAIKFGTESNAGFKNITISNCVIRPSKDKDPIYGEPEGISGLALEVVDGAQMNGVNISNIVIDGPQVPIFIRLGNRARGFDKNLPKPKVGSIENINISNISAFNADATGSSITGIPGHAIKNITLKNIRIFYNGGGTVNDGLRNIPENEADYPDAIMFGRLPSYGMFIRHVENITLNNVELYFKNEEKRPALYLEDVKNGKILDLQAHIDNSISLINSKNSKDLYIKNPIPIEICKNIIEVSGKESKSIFLTDINKEKFKEVFKVSKEVNKNTVRIGTVFQ
jgi:polygalacturonase